MSDVTALGNGGWKAVDSNGIERYYDAEGRLHREDGPAFIAPHHPLRHFHHGVLHRQDGPAVIWRCGTEEFWVHGHRQDDAPVQGAG